MAATGWGDRGRNVRLRQRYGPTILDAIILVRAHSGDFSLTTSIGKDFPVAVG